MSPKEPLSNSAGPGGNQPLGGVAGPTRDDSSLDETTSSPFNAKVSSRHHRFADYAPWRATPPTVAAQSKNPFDWLSDPLKKGNLMTLKFAIITCSDTRSMKEDTAGAALEELIKKEGWEVASHIVVQDDRVLIAGSILEACDEIGADIVLTCGGSGLSPRDVTPEATRDVCDREVPGIAEAMRYHSLQITPYAMLSRAIAAQRGNTLVINLPGSEKAARENWEGIVSALGHAGHMMAGEGHNK